MEKQIIDHWVQDYLKAWDSNDPADVGALFAEEAAYYTAPFDKPWKGREGIVQGWLNRKDDPGTYRFRYEILATGENLGVVRGWTDYSNPERKYSNIWVIRFDELGRCTEFTEWWMAPR